MKKLLLAIALISSASIASAQAVAQDWTKTDCDGNTWQLYPMLDSGKVCVMEFVMPTSCPGCHDAAVRLESIWGQFNVTNPGKVEMFAIAYNNSYTCTQLTNWKTTYNISMMHPVDQGQQMLSYYGSMGMPTIVVVGGAGHLVFYEKQGFVASDTTNIKNAIAQALATSGIPNVDAGSTFNVFPNPATDMITVELSKGANGTINIYDVLGKQVVSVKAGKDKTMDISLASMTPGVYYVQYSTAKETYTRRIIKR
jgi:hypothetical protein